MNHGIAEGAVPPPRGLEKEEPELVEEEDIPADDGTVKSSPEGSAGDDHDRRDDRDNRPLRQVERE